MRKVFKGLLWVLGLVVLIGVAAGAAGLYALHGYQKELPDYRQLADYRPPQVTRIHAGDGRLMAEYAREKRVFMPIEAIPRRLIQAFLAAEDKNFYHHPGIDFLSIGSAVVTNIERLRAGLRPVGASTITQQVAKNFLLTNEVSLERKIKEALLAFRIERAFTKDEILELYLNEIYLGLGSYGVAAAALNYFNKSLDELTTAEAAFLAGLPKAPSNYHPIRAPDEARNRRDWVIRRMLENGVVDADEAAQALAEPLTVRRRAPTEVVEAEFFTEDVRRELAEEYGEEVLYEDGLSIRTTLDPELQQISEDALRGGLLAYDRRHGWRGPVDRIDPGEGWESELARAAAPPP
ncbi:MAG: transglycosylase domain-containing protein, partial [Geminicoccaceae bacterium]|nr:transglycosylase domain-containing protein [Geminicoccaceae bacterium]